MTRNRARQDKEEYAPRTQLGAPKSHLSVGAPKEQFERRAEKDKQEWHVMQTGRCPEEAI